MTTQTTLSAGDLYRQIADAFLKDPKMESSLLDDFDGTLAKRFGVLFALLRVADETV